MNPNLILFRWHQGVKLLTPAAAEKTQNVPDVYNTGYTFAALAELPFNFYFLDTAGETIHMNQQSVEICGFSSLEDSLGKSITDVSDSNSAEQLIENCNDVITSNQIKIFEEKHVRKDGVGLQFLSVKSPWYGDNDEIIGTFGCSIVLGLQSMSEALAKISELGLLSPQQFQIKSTLIPSVKEQNQILSERESLCVMHMCKGFTVKEIAKMIGLSPKTVETYIERAKQKLNCSNKAELIAAFVKQANI